MVLALLFAIPWALLRVARRWFLPEGEAGTVRRATVAIQASSVAFCALLWWVQDLANVPWPLTQS